jgi:hypothetical protein
MSASIQNRFITLFKKKNPENEQKKKFREEKKKKSIKDKKKELLSNIDSRLNIGEEQRRFLFSSHQSQYQEFHDGDYIGIYLGQINKNQKNGLGLMILTNKNQYFGEWKNDKFDGKGVVISKRFKCMGSWENDQLIKGTISYETNPNGFKFYEGNISNFRPNGEGKMTYQNEEIKDGIWEYGQIVILHKHTLANGTVIKNISKNIVFYETPEEEYYLTKKDNNGKIKKIIKFHQLINSIDELKNAVPELEKFELTGEEVENLTCPLSLSIMIEPIITSCNHAFCKYNLDKWNNTCPLCRTNVIYCHPDFNKKKLYDKCIFSYFSKEMRIDEVKQIYDFIHNEIGSETNSNNSHDIPIVREIFTDYNLQPNFQGRTYDFPLSPENHQPTGTAEVRTPPWFRSRSEMIGVPVNSSSDNIRFNAGNMDLYSDTSSDIPDRSIMELVD